MARAMTLPTVAVLAVLGVATGLHLGHSAIAEINPVHFSPHKPSSFYADMTPGGRIDSQPQPLAEMNAHALGSGCIGCGEYPEEYIPEHDPAVDFAFTSEPEAPATIAFELAASEAEPPEEAARRRSGLDQVERYAWAPVTAEEVAVAEPVSAPADAVQTAMITE